MIKRLFLFSCYLFSSSFLQAQSISEKVDSYIEQAMMDRHIPGLSLAVIQDGVAVKVKGYGFADLENKVVVHPATLFQSGSVGKQFTATAIMLLMGEGKLKLEDRISNYFKDTPAAWADITIRHLLTHTSGIPDYESAKLIDLQKEYTEDELLEFAKKLNLSFKPGEKWAYSNTGYVLLGILIHKISGRFYGDILQEKIFRPLSMETARVINEPDIIPNRSSGYELSNGDWKNQAWVSRSLNTTADGSIYISILDMIKWDHAISNEKILSRDQLKWMMSPVKLNNDSTYPYGFGWFFSTVNGHRAIQHSGSWQGYNSFIVRFPDDKLTVIVLINMNPSLPHLIARDIAAFYISQLARKTYALQENENSSLNRLMKQLFLNTEEMNLNDPQYTQSFISKIKELSISNNEIMKTFGPVSAVEALESTEPGISRYQVKYKAAKAVVKVSSNKEGKIDEIGFEFN